MMRKLLVLLVFVAVIGSLSASYWVTDFNTCPQTYQSQTCISPTLVCGYSGGITYCADPATITAPVSTATSNTDQDAGSYNGGYLIDCYAFDSGSPYCNNNGAFWCDYNTSCYTTKHRDTTCTANLFGASTCGSCRSAWGDCSGDDDCETNFGSTSCSVGSNNNVPSCGNCVCDTGANDCDSSGAGVGNGCEIVNGASCSIGGLNGVYSGCSGSVGNCVVPTSYFITGNRANYSTVNPLLWGKNYGLGWLLNLSNSTDSVFGVNQNGCAVFPDTTSQCTASTGGYTYAQIATNLGNYSASQAGIYSNITNLQTSNSSVWSWLGNLYSNVTALQTSNTSIWTWLGTNYLNVTGLQTSNTSTNNRITAVNNTLNTLINNVSSIGNYSADKTVLYLNITGLNTTKVPYTGATGDLNMGVYNVTASNYSVTGSPGFISGNSTCMKVNFNSTMWWGIGSACT